MMQLSMKSLSFFHPVVCLCKFGLVEYDVGIWRWDDGRGESPHRPEARELAMDDGVIYAYVCVCVCAVIVSRRG